MERRNTITIIIHIIACAMLLAILYIHPQWAFRMIRPEYIPARMLFAKVVLWFLLVGHIIYLLVLRPRMIRKATGG